jgi:hypothetical protein
MRMMRWIVGMALMLLAGVAWGQPSTQMPVTGYSIQLLQAGNAAAAWAVLGTPQYPTNLSRMTVDLNVGYSEIRTNAAFAFVGFTNVSATRYQSAVVLVTNSSGAMVTFTAPLNCFVVGTANVTNVTVCSFFCNAGRWTNLVTLPVW